MHGFELRDENNTLICDTNNTSRWVLLERLRYPIGTLSASKTYSLGGSYEMKVVDQSTTFGSAKINVQLQGSTVSFSISSSTFYQGFRACTGFQTQELCIPIFDVFIRRITLPTGYDLALSSSTDSGIVLASEDLSVKYLGSGYLRSKNSYYLSEIQYVCGGHDNSPYEYTVYTCAESYCSPTTANRAIWGPTVRFAQQYAQPMKSTLTKSSTKTYDYKSGTNTAPLPTPDEILVFDFDWSRVPGNVPGTQNMFYDILCFVEIGTSVDYGGIGSIGTYHHKFYPSGDWSKIVKSGVTPSAFAVENSPLHLKKLFIDFVGYDDTKAVLWNGGGVPNGFDVGLYNSGPKLHIFIIESSLNRDPIVGTGTGYGLQLRNSANEVTLDTGISGSRKYLPEIKFSTLNFGYSSRTGSSLHGFSKPAILMPTSANRYMHICPFGVQYSCSTDTGSSHCGATGLRRTGLWSVCDYISKHPGTYLNVSYNLWTYTMIPMVYNNNGYLQQTWRWVVGTQTPWNWASSWTSTGSYCLPNAVNDFSAFVNDTTDKSIYVIDGSKWG